MLTEFIRYLSAERRYSPLTVRNYKHDVEQFLAWLDCDESRFDPRSVTTEQIREWIIFRTEEGKLSAGSMNREVASLRAFFRWLHRTGAVEKDIFRMISTLKTSRRLPAFVPESRMTTIVSECGPDSEDFLTERNSLIILMFYACGLRLAELVGIDAISIAPEDDEESVHRELMSAGIAVLEGLVLRHVRSGSYTLVALPMKIDGVEAAPCRAILLKN